MRATSLDRHDAHVSDSSESAAAVVLVGTTGCVWCVCPRRRHADTIRRRGEEALPEVPRFPIQVHQVQSEAGVLYPRPRVLMLRILEVREPTGSVAPTLHWTPLVWGAGVPPRPREPGRGAPPPATPSRVGGAGPAERSDGKWGAGSMYVCKICILCLETWWGYPPPSKTDSGNVRGSVFWSRREGGGAAGGHTNPSSPPPPEPNICP